MASEVVAVFIPIIITLVIGLVIIVAFYLESKEKQMLIEKGLSAEEIKKILGKEKRWAWIDEDRHYLHLLWFRIRYRNDASRLEQQRILDPTMSFCRNRNWICIS
ncbi:MAG: hypothetical protein PHY57_12750 [Ignavibacterium sp.]|nr:hypothetical protein [Ignavibacterium sp.]